MSDFGFKQGEMVMLVNEAGRHERQIDHVTSTGIVVLAGERTRFRQDGTATNNLDRERIERLSPEEVPTMTPEQVHAALYALNEARQKTANRPDEAPDWTDDDAARAQWERILDLDARVAEIERAWPMFRVRYDDQEHDSYVLVPRR